MCSDRIVSFLYIVVMSHASSVFWDVTFYLFWEMLLIHLRVRSGTCHMFWDVLQVLGRVASSGTCRKFWDVLQVLGRVTSFGMCHKFWDVIQLDSGLYFSCIQSGTYFS